MAKLEVDTKEKLEAWLAAPVPAVFQARDLTAYTDAFRGKPLAGCVFIGCPMQPELALAVMDASCVVIPPRPDLPFNPFRAELYTPGELYAGFDPADPVESYRTCLDSRIYQSFLAHHVDLDEMLMRRLHDASIDETLDDLLATRIDLANGTTIRHRIVAVMGGHDVSRASTVYRQVAMLAAELSGHGYVIATGGGPGLMEAANLGAYCAGFGDPLAAIDASIAAMHDAPAYNHPLWLARAFEAWRSLGAPPDPGRSRSIGIPTWFYGHEPPNVFATTIAKYFENSMREEGLLAVALAGVVFAQGNGGTVQEIFQDACQNYYRTYFKTKSPMVLFGTDYWNPRTPARDGEVDHRKPVYPLLRKMAEEKGFADYLLLTDDLTLVRPFLESHPPIVK